jgi:hypothetical protein
LFYNNKRVLIIKKYEKSPFLLHISIFKFFVIIYIQFTYKNLT